MRIEKEKDRYKQKPTACTNQGADRTDNEADRDHVHRM
jgi:hypothetical protein